MADDVIVGGNERYRQVSVTSQAFDDLPFSLIAKRVTFESQFDNKADSFDISFLFRPNINMRVASNTSPLVRCLHLWHLMSLDAPTVATVWTAFVARCFGVTVSAELLIAMFLGSWAFYSLDRLLEKEEVHPRHRFHQLHQRPFVATMILALTAGIWAFSLLPLHLIVSYAALGVFLSCYFAVVHLWPKAFAPRKSFLVGFLFAVVVFVPVARSTFAFAFSFVLFACLCMLNYLFIDLWEGASPKPVAKYACGLCALCLAAMPTQAPIALVIAVVVSCFLLLLLNAKRHCIAATTLRSCADLALLTPFLLYVCARETMCSGVASVALAS